MIDRIARIRRLVEAFNSHDVAGSLEHLSAAATWSRGDGTSLKGKDKIAARLKDLVAAFPDVSITVTDVLAVEPNAVVVEWVLEGTHLGEWLWPSPDEAIPTMGRAVRVVGADLFRFNPAGKIESDEARIDVAALLTQMRGVPVSSTATELRQFAERYTAAWCSQVASSVAAFFSADGSLRVNAGRPAVGRIAITEVAQGFMTEFPDMKVRMDALLVQGKRAVYNWTLVGTNTGPAGSGHRVRISGFEIWQIGDDGLIAESRGHFDSGAYQRQLERGADETQPS